MNWRLLLSATALMAGLAACGEEDGSPEPKELTCSSGETMCGGGCADTSSDPRHCGACDTACGAGEVCGDGACAAGCPEGQSACGGSCVALDDSRNHCGSCGNACAAGAICNAGACEVICPDGQSACDSGCQTLETSAENCGACGNACAAGESCSAGTCQAECPSGQVTCDGGCYNTDTAVQHCGSCGTVCDAGEICADGHCVVSCPGGLDACDGSCSDLQRDRANCGRCGNTCSNDAVCNDGSCALLCAPGLTECAGACRDMATDQNNCGSCGTTCGAGEVCTDGTCVLSCDGFASTECDGQCTNTDVDPGNCGGCGAACIPGEVCDEGRCTAFCGGASVECNGSCTSIKDDPAHCGACDAACVSAANAVAVCASGVCDSLCRAGFGDCNADRAGSGSDGCETPLMTDTQNCGGCGNVCPAPNHAAATCQAGACGMGQCAAGFGDCDLLAFNGCEAGFASDRLNCGSCGNACPVGQGCSAGTCQPMPPGEDCGSPMQITAGANTIAWSATQLDFLASSSLCASGFATTGPDVVLRYDAPFSGEVGLYIPKPNETRWGFLVNDDACGNIASPLACLSDWSDPWITGSFNVTAGATYFIYVADTTSGALPLSNPFDLVLSEFDCSTFTGSAALVAPAHGSVTDVRDPRLRVVFNAPIIKTAGTIMVTGNMGTNLSYTLPNSAVTFDTPGRVMTVNPGITFPSGEQVTVSWLGLTETKCSGAVAPATWSFSTPDCSTMPPPTLVTRTPAHGGTSPTLTPELVGVFDRPVNAVGTVTLTGNLGTNLSYTLPSSSVVFSADKKTMTIKPNTLMPSNEQLTVGWTGVTDVLCGVALPAPSWSFSTPDCSTLPPPALVSRTPAHGGTSIGLTPEFVAVFDRAVNAVGTVTVTGNLGTSLSFTLPSTSVVFSTDKQTMTIRPNTRLPQGEQLTVSWSGMTDGICSSPMPAPTWAVSTPVATCTPGVGGMVGTTVTRFPSTILGTVLTESYLAADSSPNGYVYVGGTEKLYRMPKSGGPTQDVTLMAGLTTTHLGFTMVIDGPNIYTVDTSTAVSSILYRISSDGGATWQIESAATFPTAPNDDIRGSAAYGGKIFLMTEELSAGTEVWSVDTSVGVPAPAVLDLTFGGAAYQFCEGLAVDAAHFYTTCRLQRNTSQFATIRVDRITGTVTELTTEMPGSTTAMSMNARDDNGDGIADFLYWNGDREEGYYVCNPNTAPFSDRLFNFGTGTSNFGLALDPAANVLWAFDDDTKEFVKIE